jgi:hypothetical protein
MSNTLFMSHGVKSISSFKHDIVNSDCVSFIVEYESGEKTDYHFWGLSYQDAKDFADRNNNPRDTKLEVTQAAEIIRLKGIIHDYTKAFDQLTYVRDEAINTSV